MNASGNPVVGSGNPLRVACDIETDGLNATRIWCISCVDLDSDDERIFHVGGKKGETLDDFRDYAETVDLFVGHNFISFDRHWLKDLQGVWIPLSRLEDTLILSRVLHTGLIPAHSLEYWGNQLGFRKVEHEDWSQFSPEMMHRNLMDARLTKMLWWSFQVPLKNFSRKCVELEHQVQEILDEQQKHGFYLDFNKAMDIYNECKGKADAIEQRIQESFPPKKVCIEERYTPRLKKDGSLPAPATKKLERYISEPNGDGSYNLYVMESFNLGSPKQIIERLNETGWKPTIKTDSGNPKLCEENMLTIPDTASPAIKELLQWWLLTNRCTILKGWFDAYNPATRSIHGQTICIGAITHRMAHRNPQMGNIPAVRNEYGKELRSCLGVADTGRYCVVGVDISGVQLCVLAHYLDDEVYTNAIVNGKSKDGTDVHSVNMRILQEVAPKTDRDVAKTFIYAMLLGAGYWKLGSILGMDARAGQAAKEALFKRIPAFRKVQKMCEMAAKRGYMIGLDGRRVPIKSEHFALSAYLQSGEAIIMKQSLVFMKERGTHLDYNLCACVHDETQDKALKTHADEVGKLRIKCIVDAGVYFGLRCPLNGEYKTGQNWAQTH